MANMLSVVIGFIALIGAVIGFFPLLGWLNWLVIPIAIVGLVVGLLSDGKAGRAINMAVGIIAAIRLSIGGGFF